jgi:hypothetical protein
MKALLSPEALLNEFKIAAMVYEAHILVRELNCFLEIGHGSYRPNVKVKVYLTNNDLENPYQIDVSHFAHTPTQASAYVPTSTNFPDEFFGINITLGHVRRYFKSAIEEGYEPSDDWLVRNEDF